MISRKPLLNLGFTIVELLVVIVVIGIIATVTIVSFAGISSKAVVATLQSDLTNARRSILNFQAQSTTSSFPTSITACPTPGATELCLTPTAGNTFTYTYNNSANPPSFSLVATNNSNKFIATQNTSVQEFPNIVTDGLVLNLDAGNPASYPGTGTTWYDLSGNGNNGTLVNGIAYSSSNGGALSFNGVSNYSDFGNISSIANLSNAITISAWFKKSYGFSYQSLVDKGRDNYGAWSLNTDEVLHRTTFKVRIAGSNRFINASSDYTSGVWTNVVGSFDGSQLAIYLNGQPNNVASYSGLMGTNSISVRVGAANDGLYFNGSIAYASIYNRALSINEITQNFNALRGRYGI